jgi:hypothetical protein
MYLRITNCTWSFVLITNPCVHTPRPESNAARSATKNPHASTTTCTIELVSNSSHYSLRINHHTHHLILYLLSWLKSIFQLLFAGTSMPVSSSSLWLWLWLWLYCLDVEMGFLGAECGTVWVLAPVTITGDNVVPEGNSTICVDELPPLRQRMD